MKINDKIIIIPPYISTSWKNVNSLFVEMKDAQKILIILLHSKTRIEIPNLDQTIIEKIFSSHKDYLENESMLSPMSDEKKSKEIGFGFPLHSDGGGIEMLGNAMHHNPEQANAPDLPKEVLNKIRSIGKIIGMEDPEGFPKAEPHCNCFYCQIAKSMNPIDEKEEEEIVKDEELTFRSWDIKQSGDKLYIVTNPLEEKEKYSVFLGNPIGCTCGEKNCEHIKAVLKS